MARDGRAGGCPQRQLGLALLGLRDCPGPAGGEHGQGEEALQPTLGLERENAEAGVGGRLVLLNGERHGRQRQAGCPPRLQESCSFRLLAGGGRCRDKQVPGGTLVELCMWARARARQSGVMESGAGEEKGEGA